MVYTNDGDHENPHGLPNNDLEGSPNVDTSSYAHMIPSDDSSGNIQKLEYIYEHFQENEKAYDINSDTVAQVPNTLYPYINNDIEYGLFEDVIDS